MPRVAVMADELTLTWRGGGARRWAPQFNPPVGGPLGPRSFLLRGVIGAITKLPHGGGKKLIDDSADPGLAVDLSWRPSV